MPTYEYRREDGTTFEIQQRITEDALTTCPTTGQPVRRVISGKAGLVFKGEGFYLTDYTSYGKEEGAKPSAKKVGGGEKADAKPAEAAPKADAKSETKTTKAGDASSATSASGKGSSGGSSSGGASSGEA